MPDIPINNEPLAASAGLSDKMLGVVSNATKLVGLDTVKDVMNIPEINAQAGAYTLLDTDHRKVIEINSASACNVTVPPGLRAGFSCIVTQIGAGAVTFVAGGGVTIRGGLSMNGQNTAAVVMGRASNDFYLFTGGTGSGTTTGGGGTGATQLNAPVLTAGTPTSTTVPLTWTDTNTTPNESSFEIQQSADGGTTWVAASPNTAAANATGATAGSLTAATAYKFRVRAVGDGTTTATSAWSNIVSATTAASATPYYVSGNPALTTGQQSAWTTFVNNCTTKGVYSKIKAMYMYTGSDDAHNLMNAISNTYNGTKAGGVTFDAAGAHFDGSTGYINTGFNPSTNAANYSLGVGFGSNTDAAISYGYDIGAGDGTNYIYIDTRNSLDGNIHAILEGQEFAIANASSIGRYFNTRLGQVDERLYKNGSQIASSTTGVNAVLPNFPIYIGGFNSSGTANSFSSRTHKYDIITDGLTNQNALDLDAELATLMTAWGR